MDNFARGGDMTYDPRTERRPLDDINHARYLLAAMGIGREGVAEGGSAVWVCDFCLRMVHTVGGDGRLACECGRTYDEVKAARAGDALAEEDAKQLSREG